MSEEMMAVMMTMSKKTMAMPVMAVASTMSTMSTVPATASRESLARDGQRSRGQRQSSNRGRGNLLDLRHGRLLGGRSEDRSAMIPPLEAPAAIAM
jgi:hypothetical protein